MTRDEILTCLDDWADAMRESDAQMEKLSGLFGSCPEAPLPDAVGELQGAYTALLAEHIGFDLDTLLSWWLEHDFGGIPLQAGFTGEPLRQIDCNAHLADFIAEWVGRGIK